MPKDLRVTESVQTLIKNIICKQNLELVSDIQYTPGSEAGDGYVSATIAVIIHHSKGTLEVFLKCTLDIKSSEAMPIEKLYANEVYFYDRVYPAYMKFLRDHGVKDGFRNAPRCYGTINNNIVAMENLKTKGFTLFDRSRQMNSRHLELVLRTFAKFHAISFAFKDQHKQRYDRLAEGTFDVLSNQRGETVFGKMFSESIKDCCNKLDPVEDKEILQRCKLDDLMESFSSADRELNEYSILTQGDCWCNNMMFLYENRDVDNPRDIMLIDWQLLRPASPVYDISYFFLTIASEDALNKTGHYLELYHEELSDQIRKLGSDPEVLYPYSVLTKEWKQHCKYGFTMAFLVVKVMLSSEDETMNLEAADLEDEEQLRNICPKIKKEDEYLRRIRALARYMIRNDYL